MDDPSGSPDAVDVGIHVHFEDMPRNGHVAKKLTMSIKKAVKCENKVCSDINFVITSDPRLHHLNQTYLEKDYPTDVLSFDLRSIPSDPVEGDIYISVDQAKSQARARGIDWEIELLRLAMHGFLHLCGYDHNDEKSLSDMIARGNRYVSMVINRQVLGG